MSKVLISPAGVHEVPRSAPSGSPLVSIRVPRELLALIDTHVTLSAHTRKAGPWTRSSFIIRAIEQKLEHMARSRRKPSPIPETYVRDCAGGCHTPRSLGDLARSGYDFSLEALIAQQEQDCPW